MKITVDAGHGYKANQSPIIDEYYEGTYMWYLGCMLVERLKEYGFEVAFTRESINDDPAVYDRGKLAGDNGSNLFISLHSDAIGKSADGTYNQTATGTTVYYSLANAEGAAIGKQIGEAVAALFGHKFRGCKTKAYSDSKPTTDYYGVIRGAAQNGCTLALIVEHGFHTNAADVAFLMNDENLAAIADTEAEIIANWFGMEKQKNDAAELSDEIAKVHGEVIALGEKYRALQADVTGIAEEVALLSNDVKELIDSVAQLETLMSELSNLEGKLEIIGGTLDFKIKEL